MACHAGKLGYEGHLLNQKTFLEREEWDQLDRLLSKHGFGGYYDLVNSLEIVVSRIGKGQLKPGWDSKKLDLPSVVKLLLELTRRKET